MTSGGLASKLSAWLQRCGVFRGRAIPIVVGGSGLLALLLLGGAASRWRKE